MYEQLDAELAQKARAYTRSKILERQLVNDLAREMAGGGEPALHHELEALNTVSAMRRCITAEKLASLGVQPSSAPRSAVVIRERQVHVLAVACLGL